MTKLLAKALEAIRQLPPEEQDDIARTILALVGSDEEGPVALTADERAAIARSKAEAARGEFASDEDVRAVWAKYGL
jgi:predicted transcriptional regulator